MNGSTANGRYFKMGIAGDNLKKGDHVRFIDSPGVWIKCSVAKSSGVATEPANVGQLFLVKLNPDMVDE